MVVLKIFLAHFRNHAATAIAFGPGVNLVVGKNGQGKTNILEALSYVSLTKSFFAALDRSAVAFGEEGFAIEAEVRADAGRSDVVRIRYAAGTKEFAINGVAPENTAAVIGRFPVVVLSPEHDALTAGGPGDRRRWVDILLSQISPAYLGELIEYRRALHQRNRLLMDARLERRSAVIQLEPWSEALVRHGTALILRRRLFVRNFAGRFAAVHRECIGTDESAQIAYRPAINFEEDADAAGIAASFRDALEDRLAEEQRRGATLAGPHRDDLTMVLGGVGLQEFGSRGQHKAFLVALKLAEFGYLREERGEVPQLLLDDLFSDLDEDRSVQILHQLAAVGQCVITATSMRPLEQWVREFPVTRFYVEAGTCRPI